MKKNIYIAFHKPYGVLSQFTPEGGNRSLNEFQLPKGIYAAGRLDKDSEGLLLLSNDGPFIQKLLNPKNSHRRTYLVQVEGVPEQKKLDELMKGIQIKGYRAKPCEATLLKEAPEVESRDPPIRERKSVPTSWLKMTLTEGKNRQVRKMTAAIGYPTLRLVRISIGHLALGDLSLGKWEYVDKIHILPNI